MDADVVQAENDALHEPAILAPIHVYKGDKRDHYTMALAPQDGLIVTERYEGYGARANSRVFVLLYGTTDNYYVLPCETYLGAHPAVKKKLLELLKG